MKKKSGIKAEDILIEENLQGKVHSSASDIGEIADPNEVQIAHHIYSFLTSYKGVFPITEKEQTKNQIKSSVRKLKWKIQIVRLSVAAAILIICSLTGIWYFQMNSTSDIVNFAQTMGESRPANDTRLILQDGQEISINKAESKISYTQNGEDISIGEDQKVVQKLNAQESVFNTVIVPYGKRAMITLSEGTKVWLNSGSKLIYPAVFAESKREVYIDGEAVFEVTHSTIKPFLVNTRDFEIKVLGTVFNVSAYSDDKNSSTVLEQGKVELCSKGKTLFSKDRLTISPGTMAIFDPEQKAFQEQKVNPRDYMSWRKGYLVFDHEKLIRIVKKLSRYYNVDIQLQNTQLGNETFSGNLDMKNTPEDVLSVIAATTPFLFKYEDKKLVITSK